jgi:hypothetical protein
MRDGLYKVQFTTQIGQGAGVFYARDGRMWGGDAGLYYVGTYEEDSDGNLTATVKTDRHDRNPGIRSVFGVDKVTITLRGKVAGDAAACKGTAAEAPGVEFDAVIARISD